VSAVAGLHHDAIDKPEKILFNSMGCEYNGKNNLI
jgi:hypothetical protein